MSTITLTWRSCEGGVGMESGAFGRRAKKAATHTCPVCGWTETR